MVTLFKADKTGRLRFFIVHDLQRSLLGPFSLTVSSAVGEMYGADTMHVFESERERDFWLDRLLARKRKAGYRELYSYGVDEKSTVSRFQRRAG